MSCLPAHLFLCLLTGIRPCYCLYQKACLLRYGLCLAFAFADARASVCVVPLVVLNKKLHASTTDHLHLCALSLFCYFVLVHVSMYTFIHYIH